MLVIQEQTNIPIVSVDEFKNHLRILHDDEDKYIERLLFTSTSIIEKNIGKSIVKKLYKQIVRPSMCIISSSKIWLAVGPLIAVKSVAKLISPTLKEEIKNFILEFTEFDEYIKFQSSLYPIEIIFYAGMCHSEKEVPEDIRYAILQIARNLYEGNDEHVLDIPYIKSILKQHKNLALA